LAGNNTDGFNSGAGPVLRWKMTIIYFPPYEAVAIHCAGEMLKTHPEVGAALGRNCPERSPMKICGD